MKKFTLVILGFALICFSASAMAIGIGDVPTGGSKGGNAAKKVTKTVVKTVGTSAVNNKIKKEDCKFTNTTTKTEIKCKTMTFDGLVSYINNWQSGLEKTVSSDVNVRGTVCGNGSSLASQRASFVRNKIRAKIGYWDYYISGDTCSGEKISLSLDTR